MLQNVRGTKDLFGDEIKKWHIVEEIFRKVTKQFAYSELRTPIFEQTQVFSRSIGDSTDIVNKEMYTFNDRGGDSLTLRPEMTAALVRSIIQNGLSNRGEIQRLWYFGPFFRYERPQKGRFRQFHQFGAECIASPHPDSDVEVIILAIAIIEALGINNYTLKINTLGNKEVRENYKKALIEYFRANFDLLSDESKVRLENNPLRVLDSKSEKDIEAVKNAPKLNEFLDEESENHFQFVLNSLKELNVNFVIDEKLVRGLDYYSHTVFEFQSNELGAQDSFGGGGRYNTLFEQLGGKPNPAVGFAFGVERLIIILDAIGRFDNLESGIDYYVIADNEIPSTYTKKVVQKFRQKGYSVVADVQRKSFKSQFKDADRLNANYSIIIGQNEFENNSIAIKDMKTGEQITLKIEEIL